MPRSALDLGTRSGHRVGAMKALASRCGAPSRRSTLRERSAFIALLARWAARPRSCEARARRASLRSGRRRPWPDRCSQTFAPPRRRPCVALSPWRGEQDPNRSESSSADTHQNRHEHEDDRLEQRMDRALSRSANTGASALASGPPLLEAAPPDDYECRHYPHLALFLDRAPVSSLAPRCASRWTCTSC